jgi:hypothetical protein
VRDKYRPDDVGTDDLPVTRFGDDLRKARCVRRRDGLAGSGEGELAHADLVAVLGACFGLGETDPCHLRLRVDAAGDLLVVEGVALHAGTELDRRDAFFGSLVGQQRCARDVSDRCDARDARAQLGVDSDETALVCGDTARFETDVPRQRSPPDREQQLVGFELFSDALLADRDTHGSVAAFHTFEARIETHVDVLAPKLPLQRRTDLDVGARQYLVRHLDHGHPGAVHGIDVGEFDSDGAGPDNHEAVRDDRRLQRFPRCQHMGSVDVNARGHKLARASRDDQPVGLDAVGAVTGDVDAIRARDAPRPAHEFDLVLLEQRLNALAQPIGRAAAVGERFGVVEGDARDTNSEGFTVASETFHPLGPGQERFRGYTTPVQANATRTIAINDCDFLAELCGPNGGYVATGAGAQDGEICADRRTQGRPPCGCGRLSIG